MTSVCPVFDWIDTDGNVARLPNGVTVEGCGMPPVDWSAVEVYGQPGGRRRQVRHGIRRMFVPVGMGGNGVSVEAHYDVLRAWAARLATTDADGTLRRTIDNDVREIDCFYSGGYEWAERVWKALVAGIELTALDPYWRDSTATSLSYTLAEGVSFFPLLPVNLSPSSIFQQPTVAYTGDVETWPTWTIDGPADSGLILRNITTGKSLTFNRALSAAETLTIDTEPGVKTVTLQDGSNVFGSLASGSQLWSLAPGDNEVDIILANPSADTEVTLSYFRRWLTA